MSPRPLDGRVAVVSGANHGIGAAGCRAVTIAADLTDPASSRRIFEEAERALGPVSILVNNASGWRRP